MDCSARYAWHKPSAWHEKGRAEIIAQYLKPLPAGLFATAMLVTASAASGAEDTVELVYNDRPPVKMTLPDGTPGGTAVVFTTEIFKRLGIPTTWLKIPAARQVTEITKNLQPICGIGYSWTAERNEVGLFSAPIAEKDGLVFVGAPGIPVSDIDSLLAFLRQPGTIVELKVSRHYGDALERLLETPSAHVERTDIDYASILRMIKAGRSVATFLTETEITYYAQEGQLDTAHVSLVRIPEIAASDDLHLFCSKILGADRMVRINETIQALRKGGK